MNHGTLTTGDMTVGSLGSLIIDPSLVTVNGDFSLLNGGLLTFDIAGTSPDLFSQLYISEFGSFQGTIDFDFIDGFAPTEGDFFNLINAAGGADFSLANFEVEGLEPGFLFADTFSDGSWTLLAENKGVSTGTAATPEPHSIWLLATGLIFLLPLLRKKMNTFQRNLRGVL
jgi:hypothetical protein